MKGKRNNSILEISKMITSCRSIEEVEAVKDFVMKELYTYSIADQGFLMTMVGIQIMNLDDRTRNFDRFLKEFILGSIVISTDN
jgi:hypothetical protein